MSQKAFRAYAPGNVSVTAPTPRAAAQALFERYPNKRKCNVIEGVLDGIHFETRYNPKAWPQSWKDVTKKTLDTLPAE